MNENIGAEFNRIIQRGVFLREVKKRPMQALNEIALAEAYIVTLADRVTMQNQMGLCYQHAGLWSQAKKMFEASLEFCAPNTLDRARTVRFLSTCNLRENNRAQAIELMREALGIVRSRLEPPADLIWFEHGIALCYETEPGNSNIIRGIAQQEISDWWYSIRHSSSLIQKLVWSKGFFFDMLYAFMPFSWQLMKAFFALTRKLGMHVKNRELFE